MSGDIDSITFVLVQLSFEQHAKCRPQVQPESFPVHEYDKFAVVMKNTGRRNGLSSVLRIEPFADSLQG